MRSLDRKLTRDLWRMRGQVLAIAVVVACGVGVMSMSLGAIEALEETAAAYYERNRFAHVFAKVKRAPRRLIHRIAAIPGVQSVEARIVKLAILDVKGFAEPVLGHLVSIPERRASLLNRLTLRSGRRVAPGRPNEVVLNEPFAKAHRLRLGDRLHAVINGKKRTLRVVGIALSPEFIYSIGPGSLMPDDLRYGVIWMGRDALAAAYDLKSAFNDVALSLRRGVSPSAVIDRLDLLLARYGGVGAFARKDQVSNWFLMNEIEQLKSMTGIMPTIFLAVAAFLANMVLARLIAVERGEIGLLKAFGYSNRAVGWHYAKLVVAMTGIGVILGWGLGFWFGRVTTEIYAELYHFPFLHYRPSASVLATGAVASMVATLAGAAGAVRRAVALPPAEAMAPPAPPMYKLGVLGDGKRRGFARLFDQPTRMIVRQIVRWPARSLMTSAGVGLAVALLVVALSWIDSIDHMVKVYFFDAQRQNVTVGLDDARSTTVLSGFKRMPGVLAAESARYVRVRFRVGNRSHRESIQGVRPGARLSLVYDNSGRTLRVPPDGLVMSTKLAEVLKVGVGDTVVVEVLEGRRPVRRVRVAELFETYIGTPSYMHADALHRLMRERPTANVIHLLVDPAQEAALFRRLKDLPAIAAVILRRAAIENFHSTMAETLMIYISFFVAFASALAFGVVYNSARIALSERARELATLRVIGFSKFEISYILLGEATLLILASLPLGCLAGYGLVGLIVDSFNTELYRMPMVIAASTYGTAAVIGLTAATFSAALVRRRLDQLDLVAVLKTRE